MKIAHILGHNSNWNIDIYNEQNVGDSFLLSAFSVGKDFLTKSKFQSTIGKSFIDLQFYAKKETADLSKGSLKDFEFHPANLDSSSDTNIYFENCVRKGVEFQEDSGFDKIIVPNYYEDEDVSKIVASLRSSNNLIKSIRKDGFKYFLTLVFAHHVIIDSQKVEEILVACTDFEMEVDGYFIVAESNFGFREKVNKDIKILKNLSRVFVTLKNQGFETFYGYANWDALLYLAQIDIDYVSIGSYENLRKFDINRFKQDGSGGASKGFYFSEVLLNMVRADDLTLLRNMDVLGLIQNQNNIFSDIIFSENYAWNIHKPDVNKNYLMAISSLLYSVAEIEDSDHRKSFVLNKLDAALSVYSMLNERGVYLTGESDNYHLGPWKTLLSNS